MSDIYSDCDDRREPYLKDKKMVDGVIETPKYRTTDLTEFDDLNQANAYQRELNRSREIERQTKEIVIILRKNYGGFKPDDTTIWKIGKMLLDENIRAEIQQKIDLFNKQKFPSNTSS